MAGGGDVGPIGPHPPGVDSDEDKDRYDQLRRRVLWSPEIGPNQVLTRHPPVATL